MGLSRLVLIRHGETDGQSSVRYHGATDVPLSALGRRQARRAALRVPGDGYQLVVASPLARAWQTARIAFPTRDIRIEHSFREIDFGRWEGLTREEIEEQDPALFAEWQARGPSFDFPDGEARNAFRERVLVGWERVLASGADSVIVVAHKGVVRTLVEAATGQLPADPETPGLGQVLYASRTPRGPIVLRD